MNKEVVVISDLWGGENSQWFAHFKEIVYDKARLIFYDSSKLGNVKLEQNGEAQIHKQFVEFGIENAVKELLSRQHEAKTYIGCSVGGVIVWKAALNGLSIDRLITISSTRLRYETVKPNCEVINYFGQADPYRPQSIWLNTIGEHTTKLIPGGHDIYKSRNSIIEIFKDINL